MLNSSSPVTMYAQSSGNAKSAELFLQRHRNLYLQEEFSSVWFRRVHFCIQVRFTAKNAEEILVNRMGIHKITLKQETAFEKVDSACKL